MGTRDKLLRLFEQNKGTYLSGEELAGQLQVSRAAVWKAVKSLQKEGYSIDAVTNRGYCLSPGTDILSLQGIEKYLAPQWKKYPIEVLHSVDSTNNLVRRKADEGAPEGYTLIAGEQTAGRGRSGRVFYSPRATGAYLSILLRPVVEDPRQALRLTTMAAVSMCEAIQAVSEEKPGIKWVNDILIRGKKVCGILTEGAFSLESGTLQYVVLGVGVNIYPPEDGFPAELEPIAGAVFHDSGDDRKNRLIAAFLNRFWEHYLRGDPAADKYRRLSLVLGRTVTVLSEERERCALVTGIDDECRLELSYENGEKALLSYGEIRITL